jgi:uncharacterized protein YjbI with pentapeptide repeats
VAKIPKWLPSLHDPSPPRLWRIGYVLALCFLAAVAGLAVLWVVALALLNHPTLQHKQVISVQDTIGVAQLVFASVAGAGALVALVVAYRRQRVAEDRSTVFNERFATAATQLGDSQPAVRLAGAHAMAGLADDWVENRQTCVDVLCAYLRLPYDPDPGKHATPVDRAAYRANREVRHTIIRLIGRHLRPGASESWQGYDLDFTGVVFDGGNFTEAIFSDGIVRFIDASFVGGEVDFSDAKFSGGEVDFNNAVFSGGKVGFSGAKFSGGKVSFTDAEFSGGEVGFDHAGFSGGEVGFDHSGFSGAQVDFYDAEFSGARVSFDHVKFSSGQISFDNVKFLGAQVSFDDVKFLGAWVTFTRAKFWGAMSASMTQCSPAGRSASGAPCSPAARSASATRCSAAARSASTTPSSPAARSASRPPRSRAARSASAPRCSSAARSTSVIRLTGHIRRSSTGRTQRLV